MCDISPTLSIINSNFHIAERFFIINLSEALLPHCPPPVCHSCHNKNISNISLHTYRHPSQDKMLICDAIFVSSCRGRTWLSGEDMQIQDIYQSSSDLVKSYNTFPTPSLDFVSPTMQYITAMHFSINHLSGYHLSPNRRCRWEAPQAIHMTVCTFSHALWWRCHYHLNDIL